MSEQIDIKVTAAQIESTREFIRGRIRSLIIDTQYSSEPGAIAGYMSDLRALNFICPTDARTQMLAPVKTPSREEQDAAQQQASRLFAEREKAALAS